MLIIGAGNQGALSDQPGSPNQNKIISFAHALKEHEGFNLIRIEDINPQKAWKAMDIWGCVAAYHLPVDIVVIATNDDAHYDCLNFALGYNPKLVIVEKPICNDLQQAREIVALYKEKGIALMVNYTRRFIPELQELKRRYEAGEFGKLLNAYTIFNRGLLHSCSHAVDFMQWLAGDEGQRYYFEQKADYRIWQLDLFFEKYHWREERISDMPVPSYYGRHMWHLAENAHAFLEGKEPLRCTGEDALKTLEICFGLMEGAD